jgi:glycogen debranching enzyme
MTRPPAFTEESEPVPAATVTLVEGETFAISDAGGDMASRGVEGLFVADTRVCSRLSLSVNGSPIEPLTVTKRAPFAASFVGRTSDRALLVFRDLWVGRGMRVDMRVRNLTTEACTVRLRVAVDADMADLFAVKEGREEPGATRCAATDGTLTFSAGDDHEGLIVRGRGDARAASDGTLHWKVDVAGGDEWATCLELVAVRAGEPVVPQYPCSQPTERMVPTARQVRWTKRLPRLDSDIPGLAEAVTHTGDDLGGLRLFDPDHPDDPVIAAGAPWYMTLFGRDSILTAWMALLLDPNLAAATLRALARLQGTRRDARTREEPGRILHEVRFSRGPSLALADGDVYYGTVDATPLFVMLVHELWRWGAHWGEIRALLRAVDAALDWIAGPGDPDGDGYVEYGRPGAGSPENQGWKDSFDGVSFADGRVPEAPIALAEVQAYVYGAWRAGAALADAAGDPSAAAARAQRADTLSAQFERDFWMPTRGAFALALDRDKTPVDAIASNMGHCLWTGIVTDRDKTAAVARWLVSPEMYTGWGVRTLATSMRRYNPLSYHNGSAWPHDTAICVAGLRKAGFVDAALRIAGGLLSAADASGGRLPELFAGLTVADMPVPVPYPASCSPQAWASAAPLLLLRALLGLEPDVPGGRVELDPILPEGATRLHLVDMPLGPNRVTIEVDGDAVAVRGLPRGLALVRPSA